MTPSQACLEACQAIVACGSGGAGGGPSLPDCTGPCNEALATCSPSELSDVLACLTPHIVPNCDEDDYMACVNSIACVGQGGGEA